MSLGKPTEMTLRDLLVEELKRKGVGTFAVLYNKENQNKWVKIFHLKKEY
jgi:hypothetical protein